MIRRAARELPAAELSGFRELTGLRVPIAVALVAIGLVIGLAVTAFAPRPRALESAATAIAPVSSAPGLSARLEALRPNASAAAALQSLLSTWGYDKSIDGEIDPEDYAEAVTSRAPLSVTAVRGGPQMLQSLDLPAVLELASPDGEARYVALLGLDRSGGAQLAVSGEAIELSRSELERLWTGRAFYLWTNFESLPALTPGMKGAAIRWLQARLAELGYLQPGDATEEYDEATAAAVRAFLRANGLEASDELRHDGLLALYQALDYTTPRLFALEDEN